MLDILGVICTMVNMKLIKAVVALCVLIGCLFLSGCATTDLNEHFMRGMTITNWAYATK